MVLYAGVSSEQKWSRRLLGHSQEEQTAVPSNTSAPAAAEPSPGSAPSNITANETAATNTTTQKALSNLKQLEEKIEQKIEDVEDHQTKGEVVGAAVFGSLILAGMVGCAGYVVFKRLKKKRQQSSPGRRDGTAYEAAERMFAGGNEI